MKQKHKAYLRSNRCCGCSMCSTTFWEQLRNKKTRCSVRSSGESNIEKHKECATENRTLICHCTLIFYDLLCTSEIWYQNIIFLLYIKKPAVQPRLSLLRRRFSMDHQSNANPIISSFPITSTCLNVLFILVAGVNKQYYIQPYISAKKQREKKNQVRCGDKAKISSDAVKKSVASLLFWVYKDF